MNKTLSIWFLLLPLLSMAQLKHDYNWVFGDNIGISFEVGLLPNLFSNYPISRNFEPNASISDSLGQLQLYLSYDRGATAPPPVIRSRDGQTIINGDSINLYVSATNGSIFLPLTSDSIYLFHIGTEPQPCQYFLCLTLYYSLAIKTPSDNWEIVEKNVPLMNDKVEESLLPVKHFDGKKWWLIVHEQRINHPDSASYNYFVFEIGNQISSHIQSLNTPHQTIASMAGEMVFCSQNNTLYHAVTGDNIIYSYHFSRCNGTFIVQDSFVVSSGNLDVYSIAISYPYLYMALTDYTQFPLGAGKIQQYAIQNNKLVFSSTIFSELSSGFTLGQLEPAPDGNIWVTSNYTGNNSALKNKYQKHLGIIRNSNTDSAAFFAEYFYIGANARTNIGLPSFPNYNLGPEGVFLANAGKDTVLCSNTNSTGVAIGVPPVPNVTYLWQPAAGLSATTIAQPTANPAQSMWYYLTATDTTATSCAVNTDSVYVKVETCTGITETPSGERWDYRLKPNLFHSGKTATINLALEETGTVEIYSIQGALVGSYTVEQGKNVLTLDKALTAAGVYIYKVYTGNQLRHTDKLVVVQ